MILPLRRIPARVATPPLRLSLALQGGGAHGAFTWGVLDRLLEEPTLEIAGVSGTSAGAVNAVALAWGWCRGGREGARLALDDLWLEIARRVPRAQVAAGGVGIMALDLATHLFSPYQLNPWGIDPLREVLEGLVDFAVLRRNCPMRLLIAATHVRSGDCRLFREHELTAEMVLASTCLPQIHQAVTVGDELYWDGGFSSNPPVLALAEEGQGEPLLVVRINPLEAREPPRRAGAIRQRTAQLMFGRPLAVELAHLEHLRGLAHHPIAWLTPKLRRLARLDLQIIDGDEVLAELDPVTRLVPDLRVLEHLREEGWAAAERWLQARGGTRAQA